jgi:hypothetical protein
LGGIFTILEHKMGVKNKKNTPLFLAQSYNKKGGKKSAKK